MIGYISGQVIDQSDSEIIVLCRGLGYKVFCSQNTLDDIQGRKVVQLWVHNHVKEDIFALYGFSSKVEQKLFLSLLKVNGIGPKLAIGALSGAPLDVILSAIENEDVKTLVKLPKVGKKTAEQMVLTLRGKLVLEEAPSTIVPRPHQEIVSALVNLGFAAPNVETVVGQLPSDVEFEQGVRQSLQELSGH